MKLRLVISRRKKSVPAVIFVTVAKTVKSSWVVTDNHRVHALSNGYLPRIILAHPLRGATLAEGRSLGVLMADGLPAESAKHLAHCRGIRCSFQHLSGSHRRNPKLCSRIARSPCSGRPALVRRNLVEKVDDE
jgi:hypothetical protein